MFYSTQNRKTDMNDTGGFLDSMFDILKISISLGVFIVSSSIVVYMANRIPDFFIFLIFSSISLMMFYVISSHVRRRLMRR
jgi:hypothetical protein